VVETLVQVRLSNTELWLHQPGKSAFPLMESKRTGVPVLTSINPQAIIHPNDNQLPLLFLISEDYEDLSQSPALTN